MLPKARCSPRIFSAGEGATRSPFGCEPFPLKIEPD